MCLQYAYTVIVNLLLVEHKVVCMYNGKSIHIHHKHNTIRQLFSSRVISVDYVKSKDNKKDSLTKGLVEKSLKGMRLKPVKEEVDTMDTQPS